MELTVTTAQSWVIIITSLTTAIVAIITAWKVNAVHTLVNSAATEQRAEIAMLRNIIAVKQTEAAIAESTRTTLAAQTATSQMSKQVQE